MESFRNVIRGWLGKLLLILFLTPLALVGIEGYFSGGQKEDVAKTVNGQDISKKDLEAQTKSYKDQLLNSERVKGDESLLNMGFIQNSVLDNLIARTLLIQQAEKLGISLSDAQIEQMIAQQPNFQENGKFSDTLYANYLRSIGMTSQALIANLRQDHALKMLMSSITDYALVSKLDIQQVYNLQSEQRNLFLSSIKLDDYKKDVKVTNQEVADYYKKYPNKFKQVASVDVDYVVLSPAMLTKLNTEVTEAELKQAYAQFVEKQNQDVKREVKHILITTDARSAAEAEKLANEVYAKIKAGLPFAQAAAQFSEDPSSKSNGGLVESYTVGVFGNEFDQAVNSAQKGQISKPVKTQFGYHIIEVAQAANSVPSFEAKKAELTAEVIKAKSANIFSDTVNSLNELVVSSDALDPVSQQVKDTKVQSVNGVTLATQNVVLADPNVKTKLFNDDVKNGDRNASSNIQLANGDTVWVKVRNYHAAGVQPLAQASAKIKALLIEQKAYEAAKAKIATMLVEFKTQPAQQVLAKNKFAFEHAGIFTRSQGLKREIERVAFSLPAPKAGMWSVTTATLPNEMVVIAVADVTKSSAESLNPQEAQQLTQLYQQLRGQQELDDYTQYLKSKAKIK
ncbi:SurA N-terminal domain-containing protein [Acinetobacter silvestris]|uniref:Periplasmic chaperone PpiD n=1 Tax=Acinetobacter silvestris TaxID=1977882 RepID=A0A1Y3CDD3_9GAMM|nr:SurA N-terminal domain-containing protein [Acinetobacter silvestris]OTG65079.1 peptidylprolyl isomerase [Acinetobacter silvestris]